MRHIIAKLETGYCGETVYDAVSVPDNLSNSQIDDWVWDGEYEVTCIPGRNL